MSDAEIVDSSMLGGLQPIRLPRVRHERPEREHWEATRLTSMRALLEPGMVIYDVGSEMGDLSALYALWGCDVVLCEANPKAWPWARLTFEANELTSRATWWGFVSDTEASGATGGLPYDDADWPAAAYGPLEPETGFVTHHERGPEWATTTIDMLSGVLDGDPDAITVDVEGHELKVMRGAEQTLHGHRPLVWLSVHPDFMAEQGDTVSDLDEFMFSCGYVERFLSTDHERHMLYLPTEKADEVWPR